MHWTRRHSRGRPPHPDVLTPAEWRVLDLVREGKTNAEIANDLGLAIATVKTHVSRIFEKTGTANRQELSTWDGAPSEASRAVLGRGFVAEMLGWLSGASTGAKVAGVGLAGVVLVGSVALVFGVFGSDSSRGGAGVPLTGSYLEWRMESQLVNHPSAESFEGRPSTLMHREWYVDETRWRIESESRSFKLRDVTSTIAVAEDPDATLLHDRLTDTWTRITPATGPPAAQRSLVGPRPEDDLDELTSWLEASYSTTVSLTGSSEHLGRQVELIEFEHDREEHVVAVDGETMTILAHDITPRGAGYQMRSEVTHFEPAASIDRALFDLAPPPDAAIIADFVNNEHPSCPRPRVPARPRDGDFPVHMGSLSARIPDEWTIGGGGSTSMCSGLREHTWLLPADGSGEGYILFDQAPILTGIPHWLAEGESIDVAGHRGYRTSEGGVERLIWEHGGIVAMLETDSASHEDLLGIATSAYIVPDGPAATP